MADDEAGRAATNDPETTPSQPPLERAATSSGTHHAQGPLLTTGDMARLAGSTLRTVRFYEEAGLLNVSRNEGGHRLFDQASLHRLRLASDLRAAGLSLHDIKELFELKAHCSSSAEASSLIADRLAGRIDEMQRTIALLRRLREELASSVAVIEECGLCNNKCTFPDRCCACEVLARPDLPRAARILWST